MKKLANFGRKIRRLFSKKRKNKNVSAMKYFTILKKNVIFIKIAFEHLDVYLNLINRFLKNAFAVFSCTYLL